MSPFSNENQADRQWFLGVVFLLAVSFFTFSARSADVLDPALSSVPQWDLSKGESVLWKAKLFDVGAVTASGGRVFAGAEETPTAAGVSRRASVTCLSVDGKIQWESFHDRIGRRILDMGQPIRSKPCVDGDRVYYVSNRGELMCISIFGAQNDESNASSGAQSAPAEPKVLWKLDMPADLKVYRREAGDVGNPTSSVVIVGNLAFCVTGHGRSGTHELPYGVMSEANHLEKVRALPDPPSFLAVDKLTGKIAWSSSEPGEAILHGQWSSPVYARVNGQDEIIFPGGDGFLYGFVAGTGALLWKLDCNEPGAKDWFTDDIGWPDLKAAKNFFVATPVVHENMLFVGLNKDYEFPSPGPLLAIDLAASGPGIAPAIKWKFQAPEFGCTYTSVAVADGIVFTVSNQCEVYALSEETGIELWRSCLETDARNLFGSPVVDHGLLYAPSESVITVFLAGPEKKIVSRFETYSLSVGTPEFAGKRMYVMDWDGVLAVRLPDEILRAQR